MERRTFLTRLSAKAAVILGVPAGVAVLEEYGPELVLPGIHGPLRVRKVSRTTLLSEAQAQGYAYNYAMAPYGQWLAYQQAQQAYMQQLQQMQAQMAWLQQQHLATLSMMMDRYRQGRIGRPQPWEGARSLYAYARNSGGETVVFGANANRDPVEIQDTVKGAESVFGRLAPNYSRREREQAIGPQSDERRVQIRMPNGALEVGSAYDTQTGIFGVTDNENYRDPTGRKGAVAKFKMGTDGEKYEIV